MGFQTRACAPASAFPLASLCQRAAHCICGESSDLKLVGGELLCAPCRGDFTYLEMLKERGVRTMLEAHELLTLARRGTE